MSSAPQIKRLMRPLIARNPEIVPIFGYLYCHLPLTHCARYIIIDNRPSQGYFTLHWCIHHLFELGTAIERGLGRTTGWVGRSLRFKPPGQTGTFEWADPTMQGDFIDQVETEILPLFRSLDTLEKSVAFVGARRDKELDQYPPWRTLMHVALGDIPAAQTLWRPKMHWYVRGQPIPGPDTHLSFGQFCDLGEPLMAGDRAALARLLHEAEASNVVGTKLEPHWQPTPFPLEKLT